MIERWRSGLRQFGCAILLAAGIGSVSARGDLILSVPVFDSRVVLRAKANYGGAATSLTFRGREYLDSADHGRLLQSASSFDGYGECFNPTEGGASHDSGDEEATVLKQASVSGNRLSTLVDMGFWLGPAQAYPNGCGDRRELKQAVNRSRTSGHLLAKQLTIGLPGYPNVIENRVTYRVPAAFASATFEASTGYMPLDFSHALYFDAATATEHDPGSRQGEQSYPVILATPDGRHAMGVYSPELPQAGLGYGRFTFDDVVKWNCVFRETEVRAGSYVYRCLIVIGTLAEVKATLVRLNRNIGLAYRRRAARQR